MIIKRLPITNIRGMTNYCGDSKSVAHGATSKIINKTPTPNHPAYRPVNANDYQIVNHKKFYARKINDTYYLPNKHGVYKRNLASNGVNLFADGSDSVGLQFDTSLKRYPNKNRKNEGMQLIISNPPSINPYNRINQIRFQKILVRVAKKLCNTKNAKYQAYVLEQMDNGLAPHKEPKLHGHIIILNVNTKNGKSLPDKVRDIYHIQRAINSVVKSVNRTIPKGQQRFDKVSINHPKQIKLDPDMTRVNKVGEGVLSNKKVGTISRFRKGCAKHDVKVVLHRNKVYYHDSKGNRIVAKKHGKTLRTRKGKIKHKYYIRYGISYKIPVFANRKGKVRYKTFKGSKISKFYPKLNIQNVQKTIYRHYLAYKQSKKVSRSTKHKITKTLSEAKNRMNKSKSINNYLPKKPVNVVPNLRVPIQHRFYTDLNEIEPQIVLSGGKDRTLLNLRNKYSKTPSQREQRMMVRSINNIPNGIPNQKRNNWKIRVYRKFKKSALAVSRWLKRHHHNYLHKLVKGGIKKVSVKVSNFINKHPINENKDRQKAIKSENLDNRIILNKNDVTVKDIHNYDKNIKYVKGVVIPKRAVNKVKFAGSVGIKRNARRQQITNSKSRSNNQSNKPKVYHAKNGGYFIKLKSGFHKPVTKDGSPIKSGNHPTWS